MGKKQRNVPSTRIRNMRLINRLPGTRGDLLSLSVPFITRFFRYNHPFILLDDENAYQGIYQFREYMVGALVPHGQTITALVSPLFFVWQWLSLSFGRWCDFGLLFSNDTDNHPLRSSGD
ncbi:Uncharacterised protein [Leclercia adecarboxylata]|uniref:Uncharacterized protein n=1 Tax=Leclercia adecarboxylata TaxID=83655 RepID=A0A4U9HU11_9ENTR|nr:Uncharacterised protein [Leclercia adecarboxylata]